MPRHGPTVENALFSSSVETLSLFEHLFDRRTCGVSLLFRVAKPGAVNARLGHVHRSTQCDPHVSWPRTRTEGLLGGGVEVIEHEVTHKRRSHHRTKLDVDRVGELGMLHPSRVRGAWDDPTGRS